MAMASWDLKEAIVKGLGFRADEFRISGFDMRDVLVGQSVAYEFDVEVDDKVLPVKLLEDHEVDAAIMRKVILAEGAVITVNGAKSVSLRHAIDLPLPFNRTQNGLAEHLHHVSRTNGSPLLSLRIVSPTSITSPSSSSPSYSNRLKLKRLASGLVELSSSLNNKRIEASPPAIVLSGEASTLLTPNHLTTLWPVASVNGANPNLLGLEMLLPTVLGPKATKRGSFKLLKADVSAQTFLKIGFGVEKKLQKGDGLNLDEFPEWRTKPEKLKMHFEVIAKVDGDKIVPEKVAQVNPVIGEDTVAPNVAMGNDLLNIMVPFKF
ncbi:hypothetical protein Cgig2_014671 [Carnegiea gigantea]|uniref:Tunicamycin induced 1 n=1 Tax=Carnegiea gigantea TaxID=171969 RepID=A0A9Q1QRP7_9CARY|nr:hypothetical protein Cgig2_014671 [Carnegiea gigantea]